jgi:hypothetical protein
VDIAASLFYLVLGAASLPVLAAQARRRHHFLLDCKVMPPSRHNDRLGLVAVIEG